MQKLDKFIDSMYKSVEGSPEEINSLKQEMREHLLLSIDEIKKTGKTEEESIRIALERFGDNKQIEGELKSIFNKKSSFVTSLLIVTVIFFTSSIVFLAISLIGNNYLEKSYKNSGQAECDFLISEVNQNIKKNKGVRKEDLDKIIEGRNEKLVGIDTKLKYVGIFKIPQGLTYDDFVSTINYSNVNYTFKGDFYKSAYFKVYTNRLQVGNDAWYIEIRMAGFVDKDFNNMLNFTMLISKFMLISIVIYWIAFAIWATLKAYSAGRLHIIWVILFFTLNLVAYLLFKATGKINDKLLINTK